MGDEQFNNILSGIKKQNNLDDEQKFQAALKQEAPTLADLRRNLERSMLVTQQRAEVNDKVSVNEKRRAPTTTRTRAVHHAGRVRCDAHRHGVSDQAETWPRRHAKAKAEDIHKRLTSGEPFVRLAADFSTSSSKTNGGPIGPINHAELAACARVWRNWRRP
jgi:hypothetical protein